MKRKVISIASDTLVLTLPRQWLKKYGISKGNELDVEEAQSKLIVNSDTQLPQIHRDIDVSTASPMIKRILGALYKQGYDGFKVIFKNEDERKIAEEVVSEEFVGFEVASVGVNTMEVKKISEIDCNEFESMLRRIFLLTLELARQSQEALVKNDKQLMEQAKIKDKEINKLADFCRRILNKKGYSKYLLTPPMYFIVEELEKLADHYKDIMIYTLTRNFQTSRLLIDYYSKTIDYFKEFYEIFYKFDIPRIAEFGKQRTVLISRGADLFNNVEKDECLILHHLVSVVEKTFDMNGPLMAVRL